MTTADMIDFTNKQTILDSYARCINDRVVSIYGLPQRDDVIVQIRDEFKRVGVDVKETLTGVATIPDLRIEMHFKKGVLHRENLPALSIGVPFTLIDGKYESSGTRAYYMKGELTCTRHVYAWYTSATFFDTCTTHFFKDNIFQGMAEFTYPHPSLIHTYRATDGDVYRTERRRFPKKGGAIFDMVSDTHRAHLHLRTVPGGDDYIFEKFTRPTPRRDIPPAW